MKIIDFQTICNSIDYVKVVGSGHGNCCLTFRVANLLNNIEHVLLKEYTTGFILIIFAYQFKKKKLRMSHSPIETQCIIILYPFIFYTLYFIPLQSITKNILAYRYIGQGLAAEVSSACSNYSTNEVQVTT